MKVNTQCCKDAQRQAPIIISTVVELPCRSCEYIYTSSSSMRTSISHLIISLQWLLYKTINTLLHHTKRTLKAYSNQTWPTISLFASIVTHSMMVKIMVQSVTLHGVKDPAIVLQFWTGIAARGGKKAPLPRFRRQVLKYIQSIDLTSPCCQSQPRFLMSHNAASLI